MTGPATGRAARLALTARLTTAQRAVALLDRKQRALAAECERLELAAVRAAEAFEEQARVASGWLRRGTALDGLRAIYASMPKATTEAGIGYDVTMGVRHPTRTDVRFGPRAEPPGSSALAYTLQAHRDAVVAAVRLAAAQRSVSLVAAELALTRQQQRALELRWIPKLEQRLAELAQRLDETDREENVRLRWAASRTAAAEDR
ncbi:V-type ATP synthase subunit D [Kribbella sp. NPDC050124]|uniref:V-type ATP synthase subunit D n=1 Tax=Kribbella sp. NPDC050124 TaxID=3364114 RepID=UPI0037949F93